MNNTVTTTPGNTVRKFFFFCKILLVWIALSGTSLPARAIWYYSIRSGDWNSPSTWSTECHCDWMPASSVPGSGDNVYLGNHIVTVSSNVTCISITQSRGYNGYIVVNTGSTLTVTGAMNVFMSSYNSSTSTEITGGGTLVTGSINIADDLYDFSYSGYQTIFTTSISNLTVSGNVTLRSNSFTPGSYPLFNSARFNINAGTVTVNGTISTTNEQNGNVSYITLGNSSPTLKLGGAIPFSLSGTGSNVVTLNGSGAIVNYCASGDQSVLNQAYSNLLLSGSGTKTLLGNTTVNGTLSVAAGTTFNLSTYTLGSPSLTVLECGAPAGSVISGNTITLGGPLTVNNLNTGNSGAIISCWIELGTTRIFAVSDDGTPAPDLSITTGRITGNGAGITKYGPGTLLLQCEGSYFSGPVTIQEGVIEAVKLTNPPANSSLGNGQTNPEITIGGSGTLRYTGSDYYYCSTSRPVIVSGNGATIDASGTADLTLSGMITGNGNGLVLTGTKIGKLSGTVNTAGGTVTKNGSGTWYLNSANLYSGGTTLNQGWLIFNNNQALGNPAGTFTINGGGITAGVDGLTMLDYPLAIKGDFSKGYYSLHLGNGPVTLTGDRTITVNNSTLTIGGTINASSNNLTVAGPGQLRFGSQDVFLKNLTISGGNLYSTSGNMNLGGNWTNNGAFVHNSGTVNFNGSAVQTLSGSSESTFNNLTVSTGSAGTTIEAGAKVTVASGGTLTSNDLLSINSSATGSSVQPSGSLIVNGNSSGKVTYKRYLRGDDYMYFSSPVVDQLFSGWGTSIGATVYDYNEPAGRFVVSNDRQFISGKGYSWDQGANVSGIVPFTGTLVPAATTVDVTATSPYSDCDFNGGTASYSSRQFAGGRNNSAQYGGGGWNLLGNPFTSAMTISSFLTNNNNSLDPNYKAVYVYAGDEGTAGKFYYRGSEIAGFSNTTMTGGAAFNYSELQAGQGFFVLARCNSSRFSFAPELRTHNTTVPFKSAEIPWPGVHLKVKQGDEENSTLVVYSDGMSTGLDPGYDVGQLSTNPEVEIYTTLVKDNGINFTRQALPLAGAEKIIVPVGVDCARGAAVTFSGVTIPIGSGSFYLIDKLTGKTTDLSIDSYTVTLPAKTAGTGRFYIQTSLTTQLINPPLWGGQGGALRIWTNNNILNIEGSVSGKTTSAIYDMLGRKIFESRLENSNLNTLPVPTTTKGVYLIRVTDGEKVATQKVVF